VSLLGLLTAVLLIVFVLRLSQSSQTKVQLGSDTFTAGKAAQLQPQIAKDGPVLFQGLRGPGGDLYLQHLGTDPVHGWLAFSADAPDPAGCVIKWQPSSRTLACNGTSFPANGEGLDQFAARVDAKGKVIVDIASKTGTTPKPS
jgi:hypothetical protein